jgi:hypothetical protein
MGFNAVGGLGFHREKDLVQPEEIAIRQRRHLSFQTRAAGFSSGL